jgi:recombination protein RecA
MRELMTREKDNERKAIMSRIKQGCKDTGLDDSSLPQCWAERVDQEILVIPTPSPTLNKAMGVGGVPQGRIIEIYGNESAGKTTLALQLSAQMQKMGRFVAFIDMSQSLDAKYAESVGVNMDDVLISQPSSGDDALKLAKVMAEAGVGLIVIDDVATLVSKAELEKEITDFNVASQARLMSQGLRQLGPILNQSNTTLIFINQLREKVGVMYGNPEVTPGGRALKYYASMRIDMRTMGGVKPDDLSRKSRVKIVKNKVAPPYREAEITIVFGKGIDGSTELFSVAKDLGVIKTTGKGHYELPRLSCPGMLLVDEKQELKFHGEDNVNTFIEQTEGYSEALNAAVKAALSSTGV